jgi:ComF family protein
VDNCVPVRTEIGKTTTIALRAVAAFVFPDCCVNCGAAVPPGARHLCGACRRELVVSARVAPAPRGSAIDGVSYVLPFEGPASALIRALKYDHRVSLARDLAEMVLPEVRRLAAGGSDALVPVPLHRTRRRERGFNQSELLAGALAVSTGLPVRLWLSRTRATRTQTDLPRRYRLRNVEGAFAGEPSLTGARVIVLDDVVTTGATLAAACGAALAAGAAEARALAVAGPNPEAAVTGPNPDAAIAEPLPVEAGESG